MITIFNDKKDIPQSMEYVELNDLFFNQNTVQRMDQKAKVIIKTIDDATQISKYKISSRFNDTVLDIDRLSAGCKTVLNVLYNPDKVFCLKECGMNALEVLYSLKEGYVYSDYAMIPFSMETVMAEDSTGTRLISDYEELKEWWNNEG